MYNCLILKVDFKFYDFKQPYKCVFVCVCVSVRVCVCVYVFVCVRVYMCVHLVNREPECRDGVTGDGATIC